jgi:micrococcal nuclease
MKLRLPIPFFFLLFFIVSSCTTSEIESGKVNEKLWEVTKTIDGDTFWVKGDEGKKFKVRLIGVDAPESRKTFKKEVGYYGKEAKAYLKQLLLGKRVRLVCDVDSLDRYHRTLAYVYMEDGTFVNADLVKNGYATILTVAPNVEHADEFALLQREARENNRGLWNIPIH